MDAFRPVRLALATPEASVFALALVLPSAVVNVTAAPTTGLPAESLSVADTLALFTVTLDEPTAETQSRA
jgi:hypothetical protein